MAGFDDNLQPCTFKGVTLEVRTVRDQLGRELDKREYVGRDGADVDDRVRRALGCALRVVIFEEDYPATLNRLYALWEEGGPGELVHPILGSMQAVLENIDVVHDIDEGADACEAEVSFTRHDEASALPSRPSIAGRASAVRATADRVDVARVALEGDPGLDVEERSAIAAIAGSITAKAVPTVDAIEATFDAVAVADATTQVNAFLRDVRTAVQRLAALPGQAAYALHRSLIALSSASMEFVAALAALRPPLVEVTVEDEGIPLLLFCHQRYRDSSRASEVLLLNSVPDPLRLAKGQRLRIYAE